MAASLTIPKTPEDPTILNPKKDPVLQANLDELKKQQEAILHAQGVADKALNEADLYGSLISDYGAATTAGSASLRRQAAEALASGQQRLGSRAMGGGYLGSLADIGQEVGMKQAQYETTAQVASGQLQEQGAAAAKEAAAQQVEADKFAKEAGGSVAERAATARAEGQAIIDKHTHWYGNDEEKMQEEFDKLIAQQADPVKKQTLLQMRPTI